MSKVIKWILIIAGIVLFGTLIVVGYAVYKKRQAEREVR